MLGGRQFPLPNVRQGSASSARTAPISTTTLQALRASVASSRVQSARSIVTLPESSAGQDNVKAPGDDDVSWTPQHVGSSKPPSEFPESLAGSGSRHRVASAGGRKPPLLVQMENYMTKELGILSLNDAEYSGQRLKICREVMGMFLDNFQTYAPILSQIMAEYDRTIQEYAQSAADSSKLASQLQLQRQEYDQKIHQIKQHSEEAEQERIREIDQLLQIAHAADSMKQKSTDAAGTLFAEIKRLEEQHKEDLDRLVSLVHTVREAEMKNRRLHEKVERLNQELGKAKDLKEAVTASQTALLELKEQYRETVPKVNFQALQEEFDRREKHHEMVERKLRRFLAARGSKLESLTSLSNQLRKERDKLKSKLPRSLTPKPDWEKLLGDSMIDLELTIPIDDPLIPGTDGPVPDETVQAVEDIEDALKKTTSTPVSLSTQQRVEMLIEKLALAQATIDDQNQKLLDAAGAQLSPHLPAPPAPVPSHGSRQDSVVGALPSRSISPTNTSVAPLPSMISPLSLGASASGLTGGSDDGIWFGRGSGSAIPPYLRFEGVLQVLRPPLSALVSLVAAFLHYTTKLFTESNADASTWQIQTWLRNFLVERYGDLDGVRWGYAVHQAFEQYRSANILIAVLASVVEGSLPYRIANDAMTVVTNVHNEALAIAELQQKKRVRKRDLMEVLGALLQYKELKFLEELRVALGRESTVNVDELIEDKHPFTARLLEQCLQEGVDLYTSLVKGLAESSVENTNPPEVSVAAIRKVVKENEPATATSIVLKLSAPLVEKPGDESVNYTVPLPVLLKRLAALPIIRKKRRPHPAPAANAATPSEVSSGSPRRR